MKALLYILSIVIAMPLASQVQTIKHYLSGIDKDHTVNWNFFCTKGRKSGEWAEIAVPSNWEQQGFGGYNYGHDKVKNDEEGLYKHSFKIGASWKNKKVFIVFEGSMTDTEVKINGKLAGDIHQGAFYRFKYDITSLIKIGEENLLEVKVSKMSANASINKAERQCDFWVFGGIFRPVYLEAVPQNFIDRVAINAKANGEFKVDVFAPSITNANTVAVQLMQLDGKKIGEVFTGKVSSTNIKVSLTKKFANIKPWNPEQPSLYDAVICILDAKGIIQHQIKQRFGFRTVEVRKKDGIYVNDKKVILKGVNHHSEWPETGRTTSSAIDLTDVQLMKEMNMNAVRMSHYPPDQSFLDICDSLGLFVLDELTGWQAKYDTIVGRKLVKELVIRDVNHPSIILWDNGNEGGWNRGLDNDFDLYDPQKRTVIHPWERFNDLDTKHYPVYNYIVNSNLYDSDIYLPTEFMHGLYDGGHGAGLEDFWNLMMQRPTAAGGFLWAFHDEAVARTDKNGWLDTDGNHAPDGILGPHREKEGSFYTIKEIWSPIQITTKKLNADFNGKIAIENKYIYTNLNQCSFQWKLVTLSTTRQKNKVSKVEAFGIAPKINIAPNENGFLQIELPNSWKDGDVLYVTAFDQNEKEVFTWSWAIKSPLQTIPKNFTQNTSSKPIIQHEGKSLIVQLTNAVYQFDKSTGYLQKVTVGKKQFDLNNGPIHAGIPHSLKHFIAYESGNDYIVEPKYESDSFKVKWTFSAGKAAKLEYSYLQKNDADFTGITFNYPENKITGMTWLGNGPYRVWKNRMKGGQLGVWHKDYNNTVTGESWLYPEFKGYHSNMYWVTLEQGEEAFTVYTENDNLFLQMMKPQNPAGANNDNTSPAFADGTIGFMNSISPIGTKFKPANEMGPQSQKNMMLNYTPVTGTLWFDFK